MILHFDIVATKLFSAFAHGHPKGQPRARAFVRGNRAAVYDPGTAEGWKSSIAMACKDIENARFSGALRADLTFYMPRPKAHFRTNGCLKPSAPFALHTQKPDKDNLEKAVLDALTGIGAWGDDAQVCSGMQNRFFELYDITGGTLLVPPGLKLEIFSLREEAKS